MAGTPKWINLLATAAAVTVSSFNTTGGLGSPINIDASSGFAYYLYKNAVFPLANGIGLRPETFGAKSGDPTFDNGPAFALMSTTINALGGATVDFKPDAVYWIGAQTSVLVGHYQFPPVTQYPIYIHNCTKFVHLRMNGAVVKCIAGLKFGTFHSDGSVYNPAMPYFGDGIGVPYYSAIRIEGCSGGVFVENGELDGNINNLVIGGEWGDTGRQVPHIGITTESNTCTVLVNNLYSHSHGQDGGESAWPGIVEATVETSHYPVILTNSRFLGNGRQGWSHVGGVGFYTYNCDFGNTGKNVSFGYSAPGAGIDMEAESSIIRRVRFFNSRFFNNVGVGQLTVGDVEDVEAHFCVYIGTTSWGAWPQGLRHRFHNCQFTGAIVNAQGSTIANLACQFHNCQFLQGLSRSPTGVVFNSAGAAYSPMCDFGGVTDTNILFSNCGFDTEDNPWITLPFTVGSVYRDSHMAGRNGGTSFPRGRYEGFNKFVTSAGHFIDTGTSDNFGEILVNGVPGPISTKIKHCVELAALPSAASGEASVDIGSITDPGYHYFTKLNIHAWGAVGGAERGMLVFYKNGAVTGQITAYDLGGAMIYYPPNTGGIGEHWFMDPTLGFINLQLSSAGNATARGAMIGTNIAAAHPNHGKAATSSATYAAPAGGTTIDTQARASLAQLAADLADMKAKLQAVTLMT